MVGHPEPVVGSDPPVDPVSGEVDAIGAWVVVGATEVVVTGTVVVTAGWVVDTTVGAVVVAEEAEAGSHFQVPPWFSQTSGWPLASTVVCPCRLSGQAWPAL